MHDHDFRLRYAPDETTSIENCEIEIQLLRDHKVARYRYTYRVKVMQGEPQGDWFHVIPSPQDKVIFHGANDDDGSLQTKSEKQNESQTKITINYRNELQVNDEYTFSYDYEAYIISLPFSQFFSRSVVYTDSFYHINPCNKLKVKIHLPEGCYATESTPLIDVSSNPLIHEINTMRPLDDFTFLLSYKQRRLGKQFWIGVGFAALSAIMGWLLTRLF